MAKSAYFIFILCGIISQAICNVSEENEVNSSHHLIRQKRIVGGSSRRLDTNPYLVSIFENGNYHCPATLLTADVAISSTACFVHQNAQSSKIETRSTVGRQFHEIVNLIYLDPNFILSRPTFKNLALVKFYPPISFQTSINRPIPIFSGNLAAEHMMSRVFNYDKPTKIRSKMVPSPNCRAIGEVVISLEYCQTVYPNIIGTGNICAVPANPGEHCEKRDTGAPLLQNNELLGIFVYRDYNNLSHPEVYMNLLDHDIRRWIHQHVPSLRLF